MGNRHPQWDNNIKGVIHEVDEIRRSESEISATKKLTNIISGALKSPVGEFPLEEYYYKITDTVIEIYDRNTSFIQKVGIPNFTSDEVKWIIENLPLFNDSDDYQDINMVKLEFKKWKNHQWNVFRVSGSNIELIGYVRPLLDHVHDIIDSDKPTPRHYFQDRCDNVVVTKWEKILIDEFIMSIIGDISVEDIYVTPQVITMYVGESEVINASIKPSYATIKGINFTSDSENVIVSSNGVVEGVGEGIGNVTVSSEQLDDQGNSLVSKTIPVTVKQLYQFVSDKYIIYTDPISDCKYIIVEQGYPLGNIVPEFINKSEYINIITEHGIDITESPDEFSRTGLEMTLTINDNLYDSLYIIVLGDLNGDGLINQDDLMCLSKHLNGLDTLLFPYYLAADLDLNSNIDNEDRKLLVNLINTGKL